MYGLKPLKALSEASTIPFWSLSIFGAEDEGGDGDGGAGQGDGGDDDGDDDGEDEGTDFSAITDPKERRIAELSDEAAKARIAKRDMKKQHTAEISDLNKRIKELEKAQKKGDGEGPQITDELRAEIEQPHIEQIGKLEKFAYRQAIENAILQESVADGAARRVWFDTSDVITNLDMDAIDFDLESGSIDGIADELNRIASAKPHLVKEKGKPKTKGKEEEGGGQTRRRGASGRQPGGAGVQIHGMDKSRRDELVNRYPIIGRR
ncbi:scaffolding protein [Gordonia phage LuckyLeo]|nr:scaffolding protein [Gordonia phage LuckyLeo]